MTPRLLLLLDATSADPARESDRRDCGPCPLRLPAALPACPWRVLGAVPRPIDCRLAAVQPALVAQYLRRASTRLAELHLLVKSAGAAGAEKAGQLIGLVGTAVGHIEDARELLLGAHLRGLIGRGLRPGRRR